MYRNNEQTGGKCVPAWAIFDSHFRFNYAMGPLMPAQIMPDIRLRKEWLNNLYYKADTLDALAGQIGVDAAGLKETVSKMNGYAATGEDLDFARAAVTCLIAITVTATSASNPCLAPIGKGPFYAMPMYSGDIGTKGGLLTNEHGQVVREDGSTIDGLYAIGNTSASVLGTTYPGAGGTLGPAHDLWLCCRPASGRRCSAAGESSMSGRLQGKVAVITGAASGIGEVCARLFVAEGAQVVMTDLNVEAGEAVAALARLAGLFSAPGCLRPAKLGCPRGVSGGAWFRGWMCWSITRQCCSRPISSRRASNSGTGCCASTPTVSSWVPKWRCA